MSENLKHIFKQSDHPDESTLWLYSRGQLDSKTTHMVEEHLLDCEMCSDVVEGFSLFESEGSFNASTNRTSEAFFAKTRHNSKLIFRRLSIAAVFLLLAGSSYVVVNQLNKTKGIKHQLAQEITNTQEQKSTESLITKDTSIEEIAINSAFKESAEDSPINKQEAVGNVSTISVDQIYETEELNIINNDEAEDDIVINYSIIPDTDVIWDSAEEETIVSLNMEMEPSKENKMDTETIGTAEKLNTNEDLSEVQITSESSNSRSKLTNSRNTGINRSDKNLEKPSNANTQQVKPFSTGMDAYNNSMYKDAITILLEIPRKDESYWDARWIIADSYLKLNKTEKAIEQYKILQDTASPYEYSASEKLHELGE